MKSNEMNNHICPCCGTVNVEEYEICTVCGWENDPIQAMHTDLPGGANKMSLNQAKAEWKKQKKG